MQVAVPGGSALNNITASIGLAVMPLHTAEGGALAAAYAALYRAKAQGRNRLFYSN